MGFLDILQQPPQAPAQAVPVQAQADPQAPQPTDVATPPPPPAPSAAPAGDTYSSIVSPEQKNEGGFSFLDKLKSDPAFSQAALMMGARLMQGPRIGQTAAGSMGDAVMMGSQAYAMGKQNQIENQRAGERAAVVNAQTQAQTEGILATTAATKQNTAQKAETFEEEKKKLALEIRRLAASGRSEEALALRNEALADPDYLRKLKDGEIRFQEAGIGLRGAQATAANAQAEESRAGAGLKQAQTKEPEKFRANYSGKVSITDKMIQNAHPDWTPQQVAQEVIDINTGKKGGDVDTLKILAEQGDDTQRKYALDSLYKQAKGTAGKRAGAAPAGAAPASVDPLDTPAALPATAADAVPGQAYKIGGRTKYWDGNNFVDKKPGK